MKLYKNLVNEVAITLQLVFTENRYADKAVERTLKSHPQWGSRDRRFVAEAVYDIVRNYRLFSEVTGSNKNFWFMTAVWMVSKGLEVPAWQEYQHVSPQKINEALSHFSEEPALKYSYPDWLWQLGLEELGEERWMKEAAALHEQAPVFLRVNTLKADRKKLIEAFSEKHNTVEEVEGVKDALRLGKRENVFRHKLFAEGWFEVQDAGSQLISEFLKVEPGQLVVDACAGAGGKSLHLAALMKNKGRIISLDVEDRKLEELKRRARRAGVHTIETRLATNPDSLKLLEGKADRLLLDVPCSGLGVLKRNPDTKWKLSSETIERTITIQEKILNENHRVLKPGGLMVYSTCSILPPENRQQVDKFLQNNQDFELQEEKMLWPSEGFDGFYMARLKKKLS